MVERAWCPPHTGKVVRSAKHTEADGAARTLVLSTSSLRALIPERVVEFAVRLELCRLDRSLFRQRRGPAVASEPRGGVDLRGASFGERDPWLERGFPPHLLHVPRGGLAGPRVHESPNAIPLEGCPDRAHEPGRAMFSVSAVDIAEKLPHLDSTIPCAAAPGCDSTEASFHQPSSGAGGGHLPRAAFMIPTSTDGAGAGSFLVTGRIDRLRSFMRVHAGPPDPRSDEEEE
jgi:hypothetical protein